MGSQESGRVDLFKALWDGKWLIIGVTGLFALASVIISLSLPNIYRSEALLAPMSSDNANQGLASLAGQFGGLASMAGISLGGNQTDKATLAIESMRSRSFLMNFIQRHDLKVPLMAAEGWDVSTGELAIDPDIYDVKAQQWVRKVEPPKQPEPSLWEAYEAFKEILVLERNNENGLLNVAIEHYSPELARQWIDLLVTDLNEFMRNKDLLEANQSIDYLQKQAETTDVVGMQSVLYQLIEEQMKTVMLAEVRQEYAFEYVDPPIEPEMKYKPRRAIICILGTFAGGVLSVVIVMGWAIRAGHTP